jgi:mannose-1-phosphate guanylyltransferase
LQAIVLVGGEGSRLRPLTNTVPKPALTLVDRPFLAYMVEWLGSHGVNEVVFACGFLPNRLREALGEGDREGIALTYVVEPERRGTAGAIRFAAEAIGERLDDRFLALNGDVLTNFDLGLLLRSHVERAARATIGLYGVDDASAFGLVECDAAGSVVSFTEKTGVATPGEVNAGAYVLERTVLDLIAPGEAVSIEREVFPRLVGAGLCATRLDGYWMDIGTPGTYLDATWDILEGRVGTGVRASAPGLYLAAGAAISAAARVGPRAVVSAGCTVDAGAEVRESVLLDGSSVGAGARVSGSILAPGAVIEPGAQVVDTMVAENERVRPER